MKTTLARALHHLLRIKTVQNVLAAALGATLAFSAATAAAATAQPLGIAFVYLGNPGDAGWTYAHEQGVKEVEAKFGDKIKVTRVENVPESADCRLGAGAGGGAQYQRVHEKRDDIISGKFNPFAGPIADQSGVMKVAAGKSLSDGELLRLNWFVQGVDGSLPK